MYQTNIRNAKKRTGRFDKNRELVFPDESQAYAVVEKMLGNGRLQAMGEDGVISVCRIPGKFRHYSAKTIIKPGDLIVVAKRDFEAKLDVVHKYNYDESLQLIHKGNVPDKIVKKLTGDDGSNQTDDCYVTFAEEGGPSSSGAGAGERKGSSEGSVSESDESDADDDGSGEDEIDIDAI